MATLMIQLESEKFRYCDMDFEECEKIINDIKTTGYVRVENEYDILFAPAKKIKYISIFK